MTDYSEAEMLALQEVFPASKIYLCDFHREQCWQRWVKNKKHGISPPDGEILLGLLRKMAFADACYATGKARSANYDEAEGGNCADLLCGKPMRIYGLGLSQSGYPFQR